MFHEAAINRSMGYGQHYRRGSLKPGANYTANGICHGLALAWIKNISVHRFPDGKFSPNSLPGTSEAAAIHCRTNFDFRTRQEAHQRVDAQAYSESVQTTDPDDFYTDDNCGFLAAYRAYGFEKAEYKGTFSPTAVISLIREIVEEDIFGDYFVERARLEKLKKGIKTFLMVNGGHAMGLGITGEQIAFMDPSHGLYIFSHREALQRRGGLLNPLKLRVGSFDVKNFAMVELQYFKDQ